MPRYQTENQISTPETTLKNTPYRSNGISKTLLTPCRRLGLSRRFKTTPNDKSQEQLLNTSCNSSPVVPLLKSNSLETSLIIKNEEREISKERTRNNSEINRPVVEDVDHIAENKLSMEMEPKPSTPGTKIKTNNKNVAFKKKPKSKQKKPLQKLADSDLFDDNIDTKIVSKDNRINAINSNDCTALENIGVLKEIQTSEIQLKVKDTKKSSNSKSSFARRLSMKKTYSQDELTDKEEFLNTPKSSTASLIAEQFTKECNVVLEDINCLDDDDVGKSTPKKLNKKRCVIYSSDEDDFVSSQPTNEGSDKNERSTENECDEKVIEDWNEKVNQIKSRIKQKEEQLGELKQAAIYKKLHNVAELDQLTTIWKKGCQDGLRHLLSKLKEHAEMDMPTLMKNLNVPTAIVYNVETDSFV